MSSYSVVDLSKLAPPDFVETPSYEVILAELIADLKARDSAYFDLLESDPAFIFLEVSAQREVILRQRLNDRARALLLSSASNADLDQVGAFPYGIERLLISPADPSAIPPIEAVYESDEDFRRRIQLAPEAFTTAGSEGAYKFHTLTADAEIKDASVVRPIAGSVLVTVLNEDGNGIPSDETIDAVELVLNGETINPLCDTVIVEKATLKDYAINAVLTYQDGADQGLVLSNSIAAVTEYKEVRRNLGLGVSLSGLFAALHVNGVENADIISPATAITCDYSETAYCTSLVVV